MLCCHQSVFLLGGKDVQLGRTGRVQLGMDCLPERSSQLISPQYKLMPQKAMAVGECLLTFYWHLSISTSYISFLSC